MKTLITAALVIAFTLPNVYANTVSTVATFHAVATKETKNTLYLPAANQATSASASMSQILDNSGLSIMTQSVPYSAKNSINESKWRLVNNKQDKLITAGKNDAQLLRVVWSAPTTR